MRQNWQLWEGALSPEQCDELIELCRDTCTMSDGTVFSQTDYGVKSDFRDTKVGFIYHPKIISLVDYYYKEANKNAFNVDANYIPAAQYGEYGPGNFYNWHHDVNWEGTALYDRKISLVFQLSDPEDYEGGDFEFKYIETPQNFKTRGSVLAFLSYNEHQVKEVVKGMRRSLVCWVEGPRWR